MIFKRLILSGCVLAALLTAIPANAQATPPATKTTGKIRAIATITIIQDIAQNIAGDLVTIDALVPTDGDAHAYAPTPEDVKKVTDAQLIFANGALLEQFLDKLVTTSGTKAKVVMVSAGLAIKKFAEPDPEKASSKAEYLGVSGEYQCQAPKDDAEIGDCDPHFWQNPLNVVRYAENIRDALIAADAADRDAYTRNTAIYVEKLVKLDQAYSNGMKGITPENRVIVTNHDALGYFAAHYGFTVAGVILPGGAAGELREPDPRQVAVLIDTLKKGKVKAIFVENITSDKLPKQIAEQAGVKVVTGLYTDALGETGSDGDTYLKMMAVNLTAYQDALLK